MRRSSRRHGASGLTLIELLISLAIFSLLGVFLFSMMRGSLAIYRGSQGVAEYYDKLDQTRARLGDDLRCTFLGDPTGAGFKSRFWLTHDRRWVPPKQLDADAKLRAAHSRARGDPRALLLRFVRTLPEGELEHPLARFSGTYKNADSWLDGVDDVVESRAREAIALPGREAPQQAGRVSGLLPTVGLMEVMYFLEDSPEDVPGTVSLYRATRSPPGGPESFFEDETLARMTPEWIDKHAEPVMSGIAFFGLVLWSQNTRRWDTERVLDEGALPGDDAPPSDVAELWWDSTRARFENFGLRRGALSATDWEDDVFPERCQMVVTFVSEGRAAPDALTVGQTAALARALVLSNPTLFGEIVPGATFLKVGDEWLSVESADGNDLRVKRGVRGTTAVAHASGTPVLVGRTFRQTIEIPAGRSQFRRPGENR